MKLVIVGGVAGGMSAAARARRLQDAAEIIVLERGPHVSFANCGLPYYVSGEITQESALLVQTPRSLAASLNLDVRVNSEVVGLDPQKQIVTVLHEGNLQDIPYDALVLSPGAKALRPPLSGLDSPRVTTLRTVPDALTLEKLAGQSEHAVVLGAGFIGIEAAEALAMRGLKVSLVELAPHVLPLLEPELAELAKQALTKIGVTVHDGVAAESIVQGAAADTVQLSDGTAIPAELIVLSIGVRPETAIFEKAGVNCERGGILVDEHGRTSLKNIWAVGDATLSKDPLTGMLRPVALAGPANRAGRLVADDIFNVPDARPIPHPLGTAIVRVGDSTAAMTGANRRSLDAAGIEYHTVHLHPNHHAGYFPGAERLSLIAHFRKGDGLLLGAAAFGRAGVDKRIDVLASAIRGGFDARELIDLDLSYSPPYGSAKDPVNFIGMIAENVLSGKLKLWYIEDLEDVERDALLLDTRNPGEYASGHLPGALNIPHTQLRERLDEVREAAAGRPVRVLCQSGVRSYIAHRILAAAGFDSASLSGGMLTALLDRTVQKRVK